MFKITLTINCRQHNVPVMRFNQTQHSVHHLSINQTTHHHTHTHTHCLFITCQSSRPSTITHTHTHTHTAAYMDIPANDNTGTIFLSISIWNRTHFYVQITHFLWSQKPDIVCSWWELETKHHIFTLVKTAQRLSRLDNLVKPTGLRTMPPPGLQSNFSLLSLDLDLLTPKLIVSYRCWFSWNRSIYLQHIVFTSLVQ